MLTSTQSSSFESCGVVPPIRIGTAGWSYKDWDGIFTRPKSLDKLHPLEYLSRFFDVVEINTSFYGHIKPELGRRGGAEKLRG